MLNNYVASLIRTLVPSAVGLVLGFLATRGVKTTTETKAALTAGVSGLVIAVYYTVARALEDQFPWIGRFLLGSGAKPNYIESKSV